MAEVRPLYGLRYSDKVGDFSLVVSPPYDVISREEQIRLHARHENNIVWVDYSLDPPDNREAKYERARETLESWKSEGVLLREESPALYYYEQEFHIDGMGTFTRTGFIGALKLEKFGEGSVFPHERTLLSPKIDRLNLMKATKTATSPIFGIYDDNENEAAKILQEALSGRRPDVDVTDDLGVRHRMWVVTDRDAIEKVRERLRGRKVFIADGHHRYETALAYRDWMRENGYDDPEGAWNYVLIFLSASGDRGLLILPTHRGVFGIAKEKLQSLEEKLSRYFQVSEVVGEDEQMVKMVASRAPEEHRIGMVDHRGKRFVLKTRGFPKFAEGELPFLPPEVRNLDVSILHGVVFEKVLGISPEEITSGEKVRFYKDAQAGFRDVRDGKIQLFFYLNPVSMEEFISVSLSGHILPQKTTYFYPKILTGLVLFPVGEEDRVG
ncbi:MAG: DUF1015 domain-containing protein [Deltaproteobacteria bacterium]|nr:MAG: DUF1015 domain-containing protein [Deltaproteobacteria bacterium]